MHGAGPRRLSRNTESLRDRSAVGRSASLTRLGRATRDSGSFADAELLAAQVRDAALDCSRKMFSWLDGTVQAVVNIFKPVGKRASLQRKGTLHA